MLFFGPPGSGKGTQAARAAARLSLPHVASGNLLRAAAAEGTPHGREAKGYMDRGVLVPDGLLLDLLFERLGRPDCAGGFVLDGFPRTEAQAEAVEGRLPRPGERSALDRALRFVLAEEAVVERMAGRRVCKSCASNYHARFAPPRAEGRCDRCGGPLARRADDDPEVVRARLRAWRGDGEALAAFYRDRGVLCDVDASGSIESVAAAVEAAIERRPSGAPPARGGVR